MDSFVVRGSYASNVAHVGNWTRGWVRLHLVVWLLWLMVRVNCLTCQGSLLWVGWGYCIDRWGFFAEVRIEIWMEGIDRVSLFFGHIFLVNIERLFSIDIVNKRISWFIFRGKFERRGCCIWSLTLWTIHIYNNLFLFIYLFNRSYKKS